MRDKLIKWAVVLFIGALVLWAFDAGMRRQHAMDCAAGHYCDDGV